MHIIRIIKTCLFANCLLVFTESYAQLNSASYGIRTQIDLAAHQKEIDNGIFYEFAAPYFGKLGIIATHLSPGEKIIIRLGEKKINSDRIDSNPGGNIRFYQTEYTKKITDPDTIYFPLEKNQKNTSGNAIKLPEDWGVILPFQYAEIISDKSILPSPFRKFYHHRFHDNAAQFTSSDTLVNQIWELCKHTIKATSFAGLYIDGDRERIPYEADALINQLSHYAVDSVYDIARNTIEYLFQHPTWPTEWHLQMHQVVWYDYLYTGNTELIKKFYSLLRTKTLIALAEPNGLISTTLGKQSQAFLDSLGYKTFDNKPILRDITDWPQRGNKIAPADYKGEADEFVFCNFNSVVNAFHYRSLKIMETFASITENKKDEQFFKERSHQVKKQFTSTFTNPATQLIQDGDTTRHTSFHANFFALAFDLLEGEQQKKALDYIIQRGMACSVYGSQFLLDALYENGMGDAGFNLLTSKSKRSWHHMLEVGAGMTTEAWDTEFKPNQDWNHAWGAAPANIIAFRLMGIRPIEPGYKSIIIDPQPGSLQSATLSLPTPHGIIHAEMKNQRQNIIMKLVVPRSIDVRKSNRNSANIKIEVKRI